MQKYEPILKRYIYWNLILSEKQYPYLGRCKAVAKKKGKRTANEMLVKERNELFERILPEWNFAIKKLFNPSWLNFIIAGNENPNLHAHFIPRYKKEIKFGDIKFKDLNQGKNHSPYKKKKISIKILKEIETKFKEILN